jgi:hypothetical protein
MITAESDQAAAVIQRRARGHRHRQQYANRLEQLMTIEFDRKAEHHQIQQWCHVVSIPTCLHHESHSVLNKFALCHWNRTGDLLYYQYHLQGPTMGEVIGREFRRCRRMKDLRDVIQIKDDVIEVNDDTIMITVQATSNDKPLLDHLINLSPDSYHDVAVRQIFISLVNIVKSIHDRDLVCGHLIPSKLYHDGSRIKLMTFGLGKYMSISDQQLYIADIDQFWHQNSFMLHIDHGRISIRSVSCSIYSSLVSITLLIISHRSPCQVVFVIYSLACLIHVRSIARTYRRF